MKSLVVVVLALIALPILEVTVLIEMARHFGLLVTLLLVFGAAIIGVILAKMEGLRILFKLQENLKAGIMPTEQLFDGFLVLAAAALFILPGFLSDVAGILLLLPPTRYPVKLLLRRAVRRWFAARNPPRVLRRV